MSRQHAAGKRRADDDLPGDEHASKRPTFEPEVRINAPDPASGQSEEVLFRIRHAAEFDTESTGKDNGNQVQVKQEQQDEYTPAVSRMRLRSATVTPHRTRPTSSRRTPQTENAPSDLHGIADQESMLIAILCQESWGLKMTKVAVEDLLQRAQQVASAGHFFDVGYVDSIIGRLDSSSIETRRRSQVIKLLQEKLRQPLEEWFSRMDQVGREPQPLPHQFASTTHPAAPALTSIPSSSRMAYVDLGCDGSDKAANSRASQRNYDSTDSTSDSDQAGDGESESEYFDHEPRARTVQPVATKSGPSAAVDWNKSATNLRVYGTICPKAAFDIFARCTISAWAAAPHPDDTATKIREYAKIRWRKVPWEQKSAWQKLFEDRYDPATDLSYTGRRLLLSQDLLKGVVPENRLNAARLHCQQPQGFHRVSEPRNAQLQENVAPISTSKLEHSQTRFATVGSTIDALTHKGRGPSMYSTCSRLSWHYIH